jgi:hypothetical protein
VCGGQEKEACILSKPYAIQPVGGRLYSQQDHSKIKTSRVVYLEMGYRECKESADDDL